MKFKALVLDCDGVLCKAWGFRDYLQSAYDIGPEKTYSFFAGPFQECMVGEADTKEELPVYLTEMGWKGTLEEFMKIWFEKDGVVDTKLLEYVKQLRKRGIPLYVGSNQEKYRTEHIKNVLGFSRHFDEVFTAYTLRAAKPQREFFDELSKRISVSPSEILFWDDSKDYVEGAKNAGWIAERYSTLEHFQEKMKEYL